MNGDCVTYILLISFKNKFMTSIMLGLIFSLHDVPRGLWLMELMDRLARDAGAHPCCFADRGE